MDYQRQSVQVSEVEPGSAELLLSSPGSEPSQLFGVDWSGSRDEPWALHFRLTATEFGNLGEIYTYTKNVKGRSGTRRRPRWKGDSIVVWPPRRDEQRYVEFGMKQATERQRVGHAFSIASARYQEMFQADRLATKTLVYVAGCGRSGTTLLQRLMRFFDDIHVAKGERPFTAFIDLVECPERSLVVKRDANAWQSLAWIPPRVKVLYCVRHPFDVLTSFHPGAKQRGFYISLARWRAEYLALKRLMADHPDQLLLIRYEDLVMGADDIQDRIMAFVGLAASQRFSSVREPLSTESVRKWMNNPEFRRYLDTVHRREQRLLEEFMGTFGYEV